MDLEMMLERLEKSSYQIEQAADLKQEIHGLRFLTSNNGHIKKDILYIGSFDLLPIQLQEGEFLSVIGVKNEKPKEALIHSNRCNIICLEDKIDVNIQYNRIQEYFVEDQKLTTMIRTILSAFFANKGLSYLIDVGAQVLGNPIFVVENNYKYIAKSKLEFNEKDQSQFAKIVRAELDEHQIQETGLNYILKLRT